MSQRIPPYVAVPSRVREREMNAIRECLPARVQVVPGSEVPVTHMAGAGPEADVVREITYWLINFGPVEMWQLSTFLLTTYFGKKLIDGFAGELGKDLWTGTKALFRLISGKLKTETPPPPGVTLLGSGTTVRSLSGKETPLYLDVDMQVDLPGEERSLEDFIYCLERFALPLIGCLGGKSDEVKLCLDPRGEPFPWSWRVWDLVQNEAVFADVKEGIFRAANPDRPPRPDIGECLTRLGLRSRPRTAYA